MTDARQALDDTKRQIVDYLQGHPYAADGVRGIREWWLGDNNDVDIALVEKALEQLLVEGRVMRASLPDGGSLFAAPLGPNQ
ncbi:MAG: hypothetical protein ABWX83_11825 [Luteibacter sp.]|jgi:hypothetical protein